MPYKIITEVCDDDGPTHEAGSDQEAGQFTVVYVEDDGFSEEIDHFATRAEAEAFILKAGADDLRADVDRFEVVDGMGIDGDEFAILDTESNDFLDERYDTRLEAETAAAMHSAAARPAGDPSERDGMGNRLDGLGEYGDESEAGAQFSILVRFTRDLGEDSDVIRGEGLAVTPETLRAQFVQELQAAYSAAPMIAGSFEVMPTPAFPAAALQWILIEAVQVEDDRLQNLSGADARAELADWDALATWAKAQGLDVSEIVGALPSDAARAEIAARA